MIKSPIIGKQKKFTFPLSFAFTFEKGEHKGESYQGHLDICSNPICTCKGVRFAITDIDKDRIGNPESEIKYKFSIDILEKKIEEGKEYKLSAVNKNFAKSFINELSKENWQDFQTVYYSYKAHITENCDLQELDPVFPEYEIEQKELMVFYDEIFPYTADIAFQNGNIEFIVEDQYCLNPDCSCKNTVLTIVPIIDGKSLAGPQAAAVRYDYITKKWELEKDFTGRFSRSLDLNEIMAELHKSIPDIAATVKKRHRNLRLLYQNYKKKKNIDTDDVSKRKIGRNEPCPCGSGKKYKICCGR